MTVQARTTSTAATADIGNLKLFRAMLDPGWVRAGGFDRLKLRPGTEPRRLSGRRVGEVAERGGRIRWSQNGSDSLAIP
jgi:hypothetical protein